MASQRASSRQLDRTTDQRGEQRGVTDYKRLCAIQTNVRAATQNDIYWLCGQLRNAWEDTERARALAAALALEPDATTAHVDHDEWA